MLTVKGGWMFATRWLTCLVLVCVVASESRSVAEDAANLRLTLPPTGYAVVGQKMSVYFDNVILVEKPTNLAYKQSSDIGGTVGGREGNIYWTFTPDESKIGQRRCE